MWMRMAVRMANPISASLGAHLLKLDSAAVFVLAPGSGAAVGAFWLQAVFVWMPEQLAAFSAVAAAGVGFHSLPPDLILGFL